MIHHKVSLRVFVLGLMLISMVGLVGYRLIQPKNLPVLVKTDTESVIVEMYNQLQLSPSARLEVGILDGKYAYGQAGESASPGFYWAAVKTQDGWRHVLSGNGIPECSQVNIFPVGVLNGQFDHCLDDQNQLFDRSTNQVVQ